MSYTFPKEYVPESDARPLELFPPGITAQQPFHRLLNPNDPSEYLILTDGACLDNGRESPRAGCAFVFGTSLPDRVTRASFRLENTGPKSDTPVIATSNRAELRAILAALEFRAWHGEGCRHLVIATDSEYIVKGLTVWAGTRVANQDLWEAILGKIHERANAEFAPMRISLWRIPREWNTEADALAKDAASEPEAVQFATISGIMSGSTQIRASELMRRSAE